MQNEYEKENDPDQSEYQFSDEGMYDSSTEEGKDQPTLTEEGGLTSRFSSYRRLMIFGGIFAGILLAVYLFSSPTTAPTEITAVNNAAVPSPADATMNVTQKLKKDMAVAKNKIVEQSVS